MHQGLILDCKAIAVEAWEHVYAISLHQLVSIDSIFSYHVHEVAQVSRPIGERRP